MLEQLAFVAIILALSIGYAVSLHRAKPTSREQLRRDLEAAHRDHRSTREIRKLYVRATAEQIRREMV